MPTKRHRDWLSTLTWWADRVLATLLISTFHPFVTFFSFWLYFPAGTVLRLAVERQKVRTRRGVLRKTWIMTAALAVIVIFLEATSTDRTLGSALFNIGILILPLTPIYALLMPLAGQRWFSFSRFRRSGVAKK